MSTALKRTVSFVDKASPSLRGIARSFKSLNTSGGAAFRSLRRLSREINLARLARSFGQVGRMARTALAPVGRFVGSLAALTGLGSLGGLGAIINGFGSAGDSIAKAADRLGLSVERYQELTYAAESAGFESFDQSLRTLNTRIGDALKGNKDLAGLFSDLNISLVDAAGNARTGADVLPELAEAFRVNENAVTRTALATKLFEAEGVGMINMLAGGRAGLEAMAKAARENGILTEEQARAAEAQSQAMHALRRSIDGTRDAIGAALAPVLLPMIATFRDWINANRELIASNVAEFVGDVAEAVKKVDWSRLIGETRAMISNLRWLVESTVGWKWALVGVAGVMASGMIVNTVALIGSLGQLGFAAVSTVGKLALMGGAQVLGAMGSFITAVRAGYGAWAAFNLVLAANPIGLLIAGVAALAGAAWLIYDNWEPIRDFFKSLFESIGTYISSALDYIQPLIEGFKTLVKYSPAGLVAQAASYAFGEDEVGGSLVGRAARVGQTGGPRDAVARVEVDFTNTPPGTRVAARSEGFAASEVNVGRAMVLP